MKKNNTVKKELPITLLMSTLLVVLLSDSLFDKNMTNMFTRGDGITLLLFFLVFIYYLISMARNKTEEEKEITLQTKVKGTVIKMTGPSASFPEGYSRCGCVLLSGCCV